MHCFAGLVRTVFPGETVSQIRASIRQKLNNADKLFKRKVAGNQVPATDPAANDDCEWCYLFQDHLSSDSL